MIFIFFSMRTPEAAIVGRYVVFGEDHSQDQAEANETSLLLVLTG